ncbi:MAG: hypothetical protein M1839_004436 [Geoglossum umbratile]|nr:MAG: hypothetical protein M1839_004436 [Geoglossum umbratile]
MFGKENVSLAHMIGQTRPMQSIRTPAHGTLAGVSDTPASKKRKRASNVGELLAEPFVVRWPHGLAPSPPQTLKPILILPRSHLPLSYLDLAASSTAVPTAHLFSAHIGALESEKFGGGNGEDSVILITRNEDDESLYAVESVGRGVYALCKLGDWVKEKALVGAALWARKEPQHTIVNQDIGGSDSAWWKFARVNPPAPSVFEPQGRRAGENDVADVLFSMKQPRPKALLATPHLPDSEPCSRGDQPAINTMVQSPELMGGTAAIRQSAQEIFDIVRSQYLETLYISRASLAYFPKGPLSRARAALSVDHSNPVSQDNLITFLRSLVLSLPLVDKKYKKSVPEFVGSLPTLNFSEDDVDIFAMKGRKKRRSKKMKPGKGGLYPGEEDYLRKWWMDGDLDPNIVPSAETESNAEQVKRRVANLRARETELQIILVLEIFALQESSHSKGQHEGRTKPNLGATEGEGGENPKRNSNKDLTLALDLLVDRLCIWQSVSSGNGSALSMDDLGKSKASSQNSGNTTKAMGVNQNNDHLRDFCNEVVMPFYAARLPEHCNTISRKLGGPTGSASIRPPLAKIASSRKMSSRPGDAVKRIAPSRPRQTLERVLTDEKKARSVSRGPSMPPTLTRSATSPAVPGLKRETSECSLWSVPPKDAQPPMNVFRGGVLKSKKFGQREIDMSFTTNATNIKLQRKAKVEEELREAITALKKPNRGLAVKEFVETSERRALAGSCSRRVGIKKSTRNALDVQVMATPKGNRKASVVSMTPPVYQNRPRLFEGHKSVPSPKGQYVPQSVTRPHPMLELQSEQPSISQSMAQLTRQPLQPSVQDTPSRVRSREGIQLGTETESAVRPTASFPVSPSYKYRGPKASHLEFKDLDISLENELKNLPVDDTIENQRILLMGFGSDVWQATEAGIQGTPLRSVESNARARADVGVQETPIKETKKAGTGEAPLVDRGASIYEALGWDETDDLV